MQDVFLICGACLAEAVGVACGAFVRVPDGWWFGGSHEGGVTVACSEVCMHLLTVEGGELAAPADLAELDAPPQPAAENTGPQATAPQVEPSEAPAPRELPPELSKSFDELISEQLGGASEVPAGLITPPPPPGELWTFVLSRFSCSLRRSAPACCSLDRMSSWHRLKPVSSRRRRS